MVNLNIALPEHFLDEEERCGYIVSKQMKEVWAVELDLLKKLLDVCEKHHIKIFASGGTMLGAVRHQGMIPWDDDIDMRLLRDDYEKLCAVAQDEFSYPYFFQTEYTDPGSLRGHAQLRNSQTTGILAFEKDKGYGFNQGIFIDIFPLDFIPDSEIKLRILKNRIKRCRKRMHQYARLGTRYYSNKNCNFAKYMVKKTIHLWGEHFWVEKELLWYKKFENECQRYNNITDKVQFLSFTDKTDARDRLLDYKETIKMPFEFLKIPVSSAYDPILQRLYGDYMKPVQAGSCHGSVFFDTENSYLKYERANNEDEEKNEKL